MRKEIVCLIFAAFFILFANFISAEYDMTQGSDWKWSYAQTYVDEDLSKLNINEEDIEFARMKVQASKEDCEERAGQWCTWYSEDNATLQRMLQAKSGEATGNPTTSAKTIWQRFLDSIKNLFKFQGA